MYIRSFVLAYSTSNLNLLCLFGDGEVHLHVNVVLANERSYCQMSAVNVMSVAWVPYSNPILEFAMTEK
jgi:hypothetical protein